ncbi:protein-disulfide reductase DsbD [Pseudoalteromonas ruthenica]|uniref:Thiol:disulfide interchange protein DsbD n=2 Tax=Pseudoalteromonas ruthenica TaxID=151081 RepID=A0A5S3Z2Q4_9GAMM|nr:protein-disulfide reductase DsbD [Pseudoalteromonas ruthenica]TMP86503.1 protein-disulfide reductase DsbD [Pseudoalteromonas ruthenica]
MRYVLFLLTLAFSSLSWANNSVLNSLLEPSKSTFLPVEQAFKLDFDQQGDTLFVGWDIEPGYYLYKHKLEFVGKGATITPPSDLPQGDMIEDEFFGRTEVYFDSVSIISKLSDVGDNASVKVRYQGCAEAGLCYPPEVVEIPLTALATSTATTAAPTSEAPVNKATSDEGEQSLTERLASQSLVTNLVFFFVVGIGLAFTPCVFPMFPILSSLIAGQKNLSTKKAFSLSFVYVQGMAVTYALLGLVVAYFGGHIQGYLQHPYVLISFSLLFVLLALSMFGLYEIRLPQSLMSRLTEVSNKQKGGNYTGVFLMGVLSGLIASPCTTAPLSAALLYVAQSGDFVVGGLTLYALSLGMGLPLLLLGTSGGKLLPKAGGWMEQVKTLFGFLMLFVPLILLERILPFEVILLMAGLLAIATAIYLHYWQSGQNQGKGKTILWSFAMLLFVGGLMLVQNYIWPKPQSNSTTATVSSNEKHGEFVHVANLAELETLIAQTDGLVMVDLYAEWCVACKEFEKYTFPKDNVQQQFEHFTLVQVDLTESNDTTIELMEHYTVFGLPSILFFDNSNEELPELRVTGFMGADEFASHLQAVRDEAQ